MNAIEKQQSFTPISHGAFAGGRSLQAEQTRVGSMSMEQSTELTITTDEGDTVTFSLASAMETNAGIYRSDSFEDGRGASLQTAFFESSRSQNMAIEVNGDLNEAELQDIREAVNAIGSMIDDFLAGDLQEMSKDGQLLKEQDSISSLEAAFSYERQVFYGQQDKVEISNTAPEKGHHHHRRGHGRLQRLMNRMDRMTDDMAEQVKGFRGRRKQLAASVEDLFSRYRNGKTDNAPADELSRDVIETLQSAFVLKIQTMSESASFSLSYAA